MRSRARQLSEFYSNNGFIIGSTLLFGQVVARMRSWLMGRTLDARNLHFGPRCEIRGARHINMGDGFSCKGGLWLEAVSRYRDQRHHPKINIGTNVTCSQNVHISCIGEITIGNDVLIGSSVYIGDHNHGQYRCPGASSPDTPPASRVLSALGPLIIEDRVFLGDKVTVLGGLRIGHGTIVAANSVVTRDLPAMSIAAGSPAKVIKIYDSSTTSWLPTAP